MKFEVGKYYKNGSVMLHVIAEVKTTLRGWCLVAEDTINGGLTPIRKYEPASVGWEESTKEEWMKNFSK